MNKPGLCLLISFQIFYFAIMVFGQSDSLQKRDPFIPLIDGEGNLRRDFKKPMISGDLAPQVNLMGISKVNNVFYAIVDGKWVKEGDMLGDMSIDKIESDKIILRFGEKKFEVRLYTEKK